MGLFENLSERPPDWELNPDADLAQGLVFFGGGRYHGTAYYDDASGRGNHGTLTAMDPSDWQFDSTLSRYRTDFVGASLQYVLTPRSVTFNGPMSVFAWYKCAIGPGGQQVYGSRTNTGNISWVQLLATCPSGWGYDHRVVFQLRDNAGIASALGWTADTDDGLWHYAVGGRGVDGKIFLSVDGGARRYTTTVTGAVTIPAPAIGALLNDGTPQDGYYLTGSTSDILVYDRELSIAETSVLANDPMLGGLILPPSRSLWPVAVADTAKPWLYRRPSRIIGGGVL